MALATPEGRQLPLDALKDSGQAIYPAFEGWYQNPDGSYNLLLGYFNRNQKQTLDIPVGPNNRVEPGGPDLGQPTHFTPRRGWGVFAIKVPKDFGQATSATRGRSWPTASRPRCRWDSSPTTRSSRSRTPRKATRRRC